MVPSCVSNMSPPSGVIFAAFFGVFRSSTMTHPITLGRVFSLHEAFAGTIVMPYVVSMLLLQIRMLSCALPRAEDTSAREAGLIRPESQDVPLLPNPAWNFPAWNLKM
jgi:hypothetical protein